MIDYLIAGKWADEVHALAIIESGESPMVSGDGGRAFGILQQHPSFFLAWYGRATPSVSDTWSQAFVKAAATFFDHYATEPLDLVVQAYNQGETAVFKQGVRAPEYLAKFTMALTKIRTKE